MYCSVHRPVNTPGVSDNKGSCLQLVEYLSKEENANKPYFDTFFSQDFDFVSGEDVLRTIDSNHRTLKRRDDKFYMLSVNPSKHELTHLIEKITGKSNVHEFSDLSQDEQERVIAELKIYARHCMDEYALNFYRDKIKSGNDLVWFGRVETERHFRGDSEEVKNGVAKCGDIKPGLQLHIHIIVSRMDKSQTVSLSPLTKSRGNRQVLDGKDVVVGFDRSEWAERCATRFVDDYNYLPYYVYNKKDFEEWKQKQQMRAIAMRELKQQLLQGELRTERKVLNNTLRLYRFIINPKVAFKNEAKILAQNILTGKTL